jgi:hypothetical protein
LKNSCNNLDCEAYSSSMEGSIPEGNASEAWSEAITFEYNDALLMLCSQRDQTSIIDESVYRIRS